MEKIKIGVIGCGNIATSAHIPSYTNNPSCEIKYFCDIIPERAMAAAKKYGSGLVVTDYHEVLADPEVEAVSVCTPNRMHSLIAIDALHAGKHVLCEKPAARIYSEALSMQSAQHETGKTLNIGVVNRFNTAVNMVRDRIRAGELGDIYHVYINFRRYRGIPGIGGDFTTKAVAGGGALIDCGVHVLDIVMYCTGDPRVVSVSGQVFDRLGKDIPNYVYKSMWAEDKKNLDGTFDVDDFATGFVRTEGPTITMNISWAQNIGIEESYIEFFGDKAGIRLYYGGGFTEWGVKDGDLTCETPEIPKSDMFQNEIDAFLRCIRSGEKLPSHIDNAVITSQILQAMYDSSDRGQEIRF